MAAEADRDAVVVLKGEGYAAERAVGDRLIVDAVDVNVLGGMDWLVADRCTVLHVIQYRPCNRYCQDATDIDYVTDVAHTASMQTMAPRKNPILNFVVEPGLIEEIDDFRYKHRFPSRAEAVKWLIAAALHRGLEPSVTQAERGEHQKP